MGIEFWRCARGYTLTVSIEAGFQSSDRSIIYLEEDRSIMMSIQELQIIKHYKLPIEFFIKVSLFLNNKIV